MENSNNSTYNNKKDSSHSQSDSESVSYFNGLLSISFRTNLNWVPEFFDGATEKITGYTEADFLAGTPSWIDIVHPDDRSLLQQKNRSILSIPGQVNEREYRIIRRDGQMRWVREIVQNVSDHSGRPTFIMGAIYDITDRKEVEDRKDQLRELELYTSIIGHDLSNDLQIILTYIERVIMQTEGSDEDSQIMLQTVKAAVDRMSYLLRVFKTPEGRVEKRILAFLNKVSEQAQEDYDGLKIHIQADEGVNFLEVTGGKLLPVVFANLFRNTVQHVGPEAEVTVSVSSEEDTVIIIFSDNGSGIPDSIREKMFQKGVSTKGGGLGLYLVRQILTALGGSIELCERKEERGATFRIVLPLDN